MVSENNLSVSDLILPIFVRDGKNKIEPIKSMHGVNRYLDKLSVIMNKAKKLFICAIFSSIIIYIKITRLIFIT